MKFKSSYELAFQTSYTRLQRFCWKPVINFDPRCTSSNNSASSQKQTQKKQCILQQWRYIDLYNEFYSNATILTKSSWTQLLHSTRLTTVSLLETMSKPAQGPTRTPNQWLPWMKRPSLPSIYWRRQECV